MVQQPFIDLDILPKVTTGYAEQPIESGPKSKHGSGLASFIIY